MSSYSLTYIASVTNAKLAGNGAVEILTHPGHRDEPDAMLAFAALTGWLAAEVHRRRPATALAWTHLGLTPPAGAVGFGQVGLYD